MTISKKPLILGFITGVVLVFVSTLGLVIGLVEFLQPLLSPGTELLRGRAENLPVNPLLLGLLLNGLIYMVLFGLISLAKQLKERWMRVTAIVLIFIVFIFATGMTNHIMASIASPDKSFIFGVGA